MKCCDSKKAIDDLYKNIAVNDGLRDSDNSKEIEKKIALSLGYTLEDIENGANLGLGCGNPIQNANLKSGEIVLDLGCGKGMDVFKACKIVGEKGLVSISDIVQFNELPSWVKDEPIFYATWVAGSITSEKLKSILKNVGFELYTIIEEELTEEYLAKWGHKLDLKKYIRRGKILGFKPKN